MKHLQQPFGTQTAARLTFALFSGVWVIGVINGCSKSDSQPVAQKANAAPALLVEAVTVRQENVQAENTVSGQVEPYHVATVAAEVANRIVRRPITQGDHVAANATLAALDAAAATTALQQAKDAHAQATAARIQAETDYERAAEETAANRQQARAQVAQAAADAQKAKAQLAQASAGERKTRTFTRQQELRQAEDALTQARTDERLAKIENDRYIVLVKQGASPQQSLDRTQATYDSAVAKRQSAEQTLSLAKEGARDEDKQAATAQVSAAAAQLDSATHQIESARAGLRIADTRETRLAVLRRQIDGLKAQEAQAADSVRQAQIALDKRMVRAPFAGRILAILADTGDMMSPGTPVARIGEIRRVKVIFAIPEASRPALCLHQSVTLTADALPNRRFNGTISALGFQADARSRNFPIEVTVANPDETLLPNMVARLHLSVGTVASQTLIPSSAITSDGANSAVYVLENGKANRREVHLGALHGSNIEITRGLSAGETIAATPQRLTDGANIRMAQRQ